MIMHAGLNEFHPSVMQDFNMCLLHAKSEIPNNVMSEQNFMSCFVFCDVDSVNIKNDNDPRSICTTPNSYRPPFPED